MRSHFCFKSIVLIVCVVALLSLRPWTKNGKFPETAAYETKINYTLPEDDIYNLTNLLKEKIDDLKQSNLLEVAKKQRFCTSVEERHSLCIDTNCSDVKVPRFHAINIQSIRKSARAVGKDTLRAVIDAFDVKPEKYKYVFLTAASSNHFAESASAIASLRRNIFPYISNYSFIYYDLGLTYLQRHYVRTSFGAQLRDFPFDSLPARFRYLKCYTWKPLIVLAHLHKSEITVWFDTSIQFLKDMRPIFVKASIAGILIQPNGLQFVQHVHSTMFSYFDDKPCQYSTYQEVDANLMIFHHEPFIRRLVVEPWSACALDPNCMCPVVTRNDNVLSCSPADRRYAKCHRYDQANLGYILNKLFRNNVPSVYLPFGQFHLVVRTT